VKAGSISKVTVAAVLLVAAACRSGPRRAVVIGEAFVGPGTLKIRSEIRTESPTVAAVKHGDRLEILQRRRSFFRVRTPNGNEGWTDERQLLAASDMAALRELSKRASHMPVQGQAFSFHEMAIHTLPNVHSPNFLTVPANEKVEVLSHLRTERRDLSRAPLIPPAPKKVRASQPKARPSRYPVPPMPKPPAPPPNWLDLSKTDPDPDEEAAPLETPEAKPIPTDDWSLVRTAGGQSGWVLTRRLVMAIPDEVAQYAEGKRIVSYFPLATVMDGTQKKSVWLWTTIESGPQPYDFQSFRVFIWNLHRHRYETAFIARNIRGFSPILLHDVNFAPSGRSTDAPTAKFPGFSVCQEDDDGQRHRHEFALLGNIVRFAGEEPCEPPPPPLVALDTAPGRGSLPSAAIPATPAPSPAESLAQRVRRRLRALTKGLLGS